MGTRYTIAFRETRKGRAFANVYGQYDGYLTGAGNDIKKALTGDNGQIRQLVNGYSKPAEQTNGMGCAAAMVVMHLKSGSSMKCGNVYLVSKATGQSEEYRYELFGEKGQLWMVVRGNSYAEDLTESWPVLYDGPLSEFDGEALEKGGDA